MSSQRAIKEKQFRIFNEEEIPPDGWELMEKAKAKEYREEIQFKAANLKKIRLNFNRRLKGTAEDYCVLL